MICKLLLAIFTFISFILLIMPFPLGAPNDSCMSMIPEHYGMTPSEVPYFIRVSSTNYTGNSLITVVIEGLSGATFKGFLLQAHGVHTTAAKPLGSFEITNPELAKYNCDIKELSSVTHTNKTLKTSVSFEWKPPKTWNDDIVFRCTFVKSYGTFWVGVNSSIVRYSSNSSTTDTTTHQTTDIEVTTTRNPEVTSLNRDGECFKKIGCFDDCDESGDCSLTLSWKKNRNHLELNLKSKSIQSAQWMAVGLSHDRYMGDDTVHECVTYGDKVQAFTSFNVPNKKWNIRNTTNYFAFPPEITNENGLFSCFLQLDWKTMHEKKWYLQLAKGSTRSTGTKKRHSMTLVSERSVLLQNITVDPRQKEISESLKKDPSCSDNSKGCFDDCVGDNCQKTATWEFVNSESMILELGLNSPQPDSSWIALGFSETNKMSATSVIGCLFEGEMKTRAEISYNVDTYTNKVTDSRGVQLLKTEYNNGTFKCKLQVTSHNRTASKLHKFDRLLYLILATGTLHESGVKKKHAALLVSEQRVSLSSYSPIQSASSKSLMIKLHASLMMAAWILTSAVGIFIARYFKSAWPGTKGCNKDLWFLFHVSCMVITMLLTVAGFVIIFVHVGRYSKLGPGAWQKSHPILGIIVTSLVIINPILALFRCHPEGDRRWIFNWAHWFIGTSAWILGNIAIFAAFDIAKADVITEAKYVWYAYVGYQVLCFLLHEIHKCTVIDKNIKNSYKLKENDVQRTSFNKKSVILVLHVLVTAGIFVALTVLVIRFSVAGRGKTN